MASEIATIDALTFSVCIQRVCGFTNSSADIYDPGKVSNKTMLINTFFPERADREFILKFRPSEEDRKTAEEMIRYFRRNSFAVISGGTDLYATAVYATTQSNTVSIKDFGILASIPSSYLKEKSTKTLASAAKNTLQEYIGKPGDVVTLAVEIVYTKYVEKIQCTEYVAVTDTDHLVQFLSKSCIGAVGDCVAIKAKVKGHGENWSTKSFQTALNYAKVIDL